MALVSRRRLLPLSSPAASPSTVPASWSQPHLHYAPGYSLLISPTFLLSAKPFLYISILHFVLSLTLMLGFYNWSRLGRTAALLITALVLCNPGLWNIYRQTMSEIAFMAALIWSAIFLERSLSTPHRTRNLILAALTTSILCLIRHVGIFLVLAYGLRLLIDALKHRRPWPSTIASGLTIALPATFILIAIIHYDHLAAASSPTPGHTYASLLIDSPDSLPHRLLEGFRLRMNDIGRLTIPGMISSYSKATCDITTPPYLLAFILIIIGWLKFLRQTQDLLALTFLPYLARYIFWPFDQAYRFMLPMLPIFAASLCACSTARVSAKKSSPSSSPSNSSPPSFSASDQLKARRENQNWPALQSLASDIQSNPSPIATLNVNSVTPTQLAFLTDRPIPSIHPEDLNTVGQLLIPQSKSPPPGFSIVRTAADVALLRRDASK